MKVIIFYLIRWQVSGIVMMPVLWYLKYGVIINVIVAQIIGASIFYCIDKRIFKNES
jgi:hypothetical protein